MQYFLLSSVLYIKLIVNPLINLFMKKNILLMFLFSFIFFSCSKEDDLVNIYIEPVPEGIVLAKVDNSELKTFALINQLTLNVSGIWIYGSFSSTADISEAELKVKLPILEKKPFMGYINLHSKDVISFTLRDMHQKDYQEQWKQIEKGLSLVPNKDMTVEIVFEVPVGKESEWIEKLNNNSFVEKAYLPWPCYGLP